MSAQPQPKPAAETSTCLSDAARRILCDRLAQLGMTDADVSGLSSGLGEQPCRNFIAEARRMKMGA